MEFIRTQEGVWMGRIEGLEVNVPGDLKEPDNQCVEVIKRVVERRAEMTDRCLRILPELTKLQEDWSVDAVAIDEISSHNQVAFECTNSGDLYGLWRIVFSVDGDKFNFRELIRRQY
jgi:hypothetical protein